LRVEADPQLGERFVGDSVRLQQILSNFIDNALKFTPRGGVVNVIVTDAGLDHVCAATRADLECTYKYHILFEQGKKKQELSGTDPGAW
jgi:signal transduction histidine kinase